MKVSIIIPVLNSHEILRRQILNWQRMGIPEECEIIIVDDGSDPPLEDTSHDLPLTIMQTHDTRPWTWALARNAGARAARGEYFFMYDIDHFYRRECLDYVLGFAGQKIQFKREFAVLDEQGVFRQDREILTAYGLPEDRAVSLAPLPNNFVMRADVFWALGGYREDLIHRPYPQGEDRCFKGAWHKWVMAGKGQVDTYRPTLYMFPCGQFCGDVDHNPFGLFHNLSRKTPSNYWHQYLLAGNRR